MSKELDDLIKRVSELEKQVKNGSFNAFGRSYSSIGSSSSDFVIKTKGLVKIQWGSKFIDLIKNGKINVDSKFIYSVNTPDDIKSKDGLYVTSNGSVYLKSGDNPPINLVGEIGTVYVSFMEELQTTSDQKYIALKNIGFLYDDISLVDNTSLQNGIIYIVDQLKLYLVINGLLQEFLIEIPNPFTLLFIILKNDSSLGALLIKGEGINNSLAFDSLYIYTEGNNSYFSSKYPMQFIIDGSTIVNIGKDKTTINNIVQSNTFLSVNSYGDSGFRLYVANGESTLVVDNIIERNKKTSIGTDVFPEFYSKNNNIIVSILQVSDPNYGSGFSIKLKYDNLYLVGDYLYVYGEIQVDNFRTKLVKIPVVVELLNTETDNIIYVQIVSGFSEEVDSLSKIPNLEGKVIFLVSSNEEIQQLRYSLNNVDLLKYTLFNEEQEKGSIKSRLGNLTELGLKGKLDNNEVAIDGYGIYSDTAVFDNASYTSSYNLPTNDCSSKLASTEWVKKNSSILEYDASTTEDTTVENYFKSFINFVNLEDNTTKTYTCYNGLVTILRLDGVYHCSSISKINLSDGSISYASQYIDYSGLEYSNSYRYIILNNLNPGYYYSMQSSLGNPINPIYIGTDRKDFLVDETNRFLWYTNDGKSWTLIEQYIESVLNKLYIVTSTKGLFMDTTTLTTYYYPCGFIAYSSEGVTKAIGDGIGVSNYIPFYELYTTPSPFTLLSNILDIADKEVVPRYEGYLYTWSLKEDSDPMLYSSWDLEGSMSVGEAVLTVEDLMQWGNWGSPNSSVIYYEIDDNGIIIGNTDYLTNGIGTPENWNKKSFVRGFLASAFASFCECNKKSRYTNTLGWNFNYDGYPRVSSVGGTLQGVLIQPTNPSSDDPNDPASLPRATIAWLNGTIIGESYCVNLYFDRVHFGKILNIGTCWTEYEIGSKVENYGMFTDFLWGTMNALVTNLITGEVTIINLVY